jgi:hypothetical protein
LKKEHNQTDARTEKQPQEQIYHTLDFTSNAPKAPVRSTNPFNEDVQKSPPSSQVFPQLPREPTMTTTAPEQRTASYWENVEYSKGKYCQSSSICSIYN